MPMTTSYKRRSVTFNPVVKTFAYNSPQYVEGQGVVLDAPAWMTADPEVDTKTWKDALYLAKSLVSTRKVTTSSGNDLPVYENANSPQAAMAAALQILQNTNFSHLQPVNSNAIALS
eukprot:TRINITY_DN14453_c0_g1_i1.p1 TRINITY_DN14453_c0_g1~~TRINITY_DN14453_c0_g1_i1.p1  ORF type:complete len:117 (+),score=25.26 TRINITY_DN14453_c0_g1_i1:55-405(+)